MALIEARDGSHRSAQMALEKHVLQATLKNTFLATPGGEIPDIFQKNHGSLYRDGSPAVEYL